MVEIFVNRKESGQELYSQLCDTHQIPTIFIHSAAVNAKTPLAKLRWKSNIVMK